MSKRARAPRKTAPQVSVDDDASVPTAVLCHTMALWCAQHFHPRHARVRSKDCLLREEMRGRLQRVVDGVVAQRRRGVRFEKNEFVQTPSGGDETSCREQTRTLADAMSALQAGTDTTSLHDDADANREPVSVSAVELDAAHCAGVMEQILFWRWYYRRPAIYRQRCRELEANLSTNGWYLLTRFGPDLVCTLPSRKLAETTSVDEWRTAYRQRVLRDLKPPTPDELPHGMFRCPRCRKDHTTYYEMQTRSADEPTTKFVTCLNPACGITFKRE